MPAVEDEAVPDVEDEAVPAVEDEAVPAVEDEAEAETYVPGPPAALPPATPLRHRDIFAQDIGGQGPRVGGFGPGNR